LKRTVKIFLYVSLFICAAGAAVLGGFVYRLGIVRIAQTVFLILFGTGVSVFTREYLKAEKTVPYVIADAAALFASVFFPAIPTSVWPFRPIFAAFTVITGMYAGLSAAVSCLMLSVILSGNGSITLFFAYMMSGIVASLVVTGIDEEFNVTGRILTGIASLGFLLIWCFVLPSAEGGIAKYVLPALNVIFSLVILIIILKYYSQRVVRKYADIYTALADTDCELLKRIRKVSEKEYRHALHVSYFCDRAGRCAGMYMPLMKCASFYHRAGLIYGKNDQENMEKVANEYFFPPELKNELLSYAKDKNGVKTKCGSILMLSDSVVSTLEYMQDQKEPLGMEYSKLIHGIFAAKMKRSALSDCDLSYHEMNAIEKMFVSEEHYFRMMSS
jgi:membrane-associated HD superfamily phosphohydrolase